MKREEIRKLLGGYATNTLTETEREALFTAALSDQDLFDAIAGEQPLRELLDDPAVRQRLLRSLGPKREPVFGGLSIWKRKSAWLLAGSFVAAALVVVIVSRPRPTSLSSTTWQPKYAQLAQNVPAAPPASSPAPQIERKRKEKPGAAAPKRMAKREAVMARNEQPTPAPPGGAPEAEPPAPQPAAPATRPMDPSTAAILSAEALQASASSKLSARALFFNGFASSANDGTQRMASVRATPENAGPERTSIGGFKKTAAKPQQPVAASMAEARAGYVTAAKLGLRYSVLKRGVNGVYSEVDPAGIFISGDSVRLTFEPNESGFLSVSTRAADGNATTLFARAVSPGINYTVPVDGDLRFDDRSGDKKLFVVFSRQQDTAADRVSVTRDLISEKVKDRETAVYVVDSGAQAGLEFEITLNWR